MGHKYEKKIVGRNTNTNIKKTDTEHYRTKKLKKISLESTLS